MVEQLKSKDFLDTSRFPNAEYKIVDIVIEAGETQGYFI